MKKILLFLILLSSICVNAQSVVSDEVSSDGFRYISGESVLVTGISDRSKFKVGLFYSTLGDQSSYSLIIESLSGFQYTIRKGMKLLLKDIDGNVIELEANDDFSADIYLIGTSTVYSVSAFYDVSEETVRQLGKGVLKIRQEHSTGIFEKEWKKDKMGSVLRKELADIKHRARIKKDFYSDF